MSKGAPSLAFAKEELLQTQMSTLTLRTLAPDSRSRFRSQHTPGRDNHVMNMRQAALGRHTEWIEPSLEELAEEPAPRPMHEWVPMPEEECPTGEERTAKTRALLFSAIPAHVDSLSICVGKQAGSSGTSERSMSLTGSACFTHP